MKIKSVEFILSAVKPKGYPNSELPEIALAGRSNVGKSSLLNSLLERKKIAHVSKTPGRTQLINFFVVNDMLSVVDLPGYGFAKVPEAVKRQWGPMIDSYLRIRKQLRGVLLLLDIRRKPSNDDRLLLKALQDFQIPTLVVLTKSDKLSKSKRKLAAIGIASDLQISDHQIILSSSRSGMGRQAIWDAIDELCELSKPSPDTPQ